MKSGPYRVLGNFGVNGHRYLGWIYLNCKGCEKLKIYWVYFQLKKNTASFYADRKESDASQIDFMKASKDEKYLEDLIPVNRRIYIKE